ncbi:MAG: hypothetical protein VX699_11290 [Myxococcota bacterium]|nr:hypothetical protein [Myxococcota bacterium]
MHFSSITGRLLLGLMLMASLGCPGRLVVSDSSTKAVSVSCVSTPCGEGFECVDGECRERPACNPLSPEGYCGPGEVCLAGVCTPESAASTRCGDRDEPCGEGEVCVGGACVPISTEQTCSLQNPTGLCRQGQRCVQGWCYRDDRLQCSSTQLQGVCPPRHRCAGGACLEDAGTCSEVVQSGTCPTWEECVRGECAGPIAFDACGSERPHGRCPADEVCVGGTCTELSSGNSCSEDRPGGLCPGNAACVAGHCRLILANNVCSASRPSGLCAGGDQCISGVCTPVACAQGGYSCALGNYCTEGATCAPVACDPVHPAGECSDAAKACVRGVCAEPDCSLTHPSGFCPPGLVCSAGECGTPPCSTQYPFGECPEGQICQSGICSDRPCSPTALSGLCDESVEFCHPEKGCNHSLDAVCCDEALRGSTGCTLGTCAAPGCSVEQPYGACDDDSYCDGGTCVTAACSPFYPDGFCAVPGEECVAGRCARTGCVSQADPNGFCAPDICDTNLDICVTPPCSANNPDGVCTVGTVCCNAGFAGGQGCTLGQCFVPGCSSEFPGGRCGASQVCVGGSCISAPCSEEFPQGTCGVNYVCNAGQCSRADCSIGAPQGACPEGQRCVEGGCTVVQCGAAFPNGPCPPGEVCDASGATPQCLTPECSVEAPGGACPGQEVCSNGACVLPGCSAEVLTGQCPANQVCEAGVCQLRPCAVDVLDGECRAGEICCDNDWVANGVCTSGELGSCKQTECSSQFPYGHCADVSQVCVSHNGTTQCADLCSASALSGWCPSGFACVSGACALSCVGDDDCDGISNALEGGIDTDNDGAADRRDRDSDNDSIPDSVELMGDPDSDGKPNFRDRDSDGDYLADRYEVGAVPTLPRDFDRDGVADYLDEDSDGDGIFDRCEGTVVPASLCGNSALLMTAVDSDGDQIPDFHDLDSDGDGVPDEIEARQTPAEAASVIATGVDHDGDGTADHLDLDSDADGVADKDEDVNGDGIVNCQVDGEGVEVLDLRSSPFCGQTSAPFSASQPYNYNPGCSIEKCLLAESSRVHDDTDGDAIGDGQDGVFQVCSADNLKPVNLFYSRYADYALALERDYNKTTPLYRGTAVSANESGLVFDSTDSNSGAYAVSGFILAKEPDDSAMDATSSEPGRRLIEKALVQAGVDALDIGSATNVGSATLIINRNFSSFDGYGVVISRYDITTYSSVSVRGLRDDIVKQLDGGVSVSGDDGGPWSKRFSLQVQTLYRYDNGSAGRVLVVGALTPMGTGVSDDRSYGYRTLCAEQRNAGVCGSREGCVWQNGTCKEDEGYQIPLFFVDNITNGSALTQYGDDLAALCQSMIQKNAEIDFLWVVDNSGTMGDEIDQVLTSTQLFFELLNQTEADYRVAQTTTMATDMGWPIQTNFDTPNADASLRNDAEQVAYCEGFGGASGCDSSVKCVWEAGACVPDDSFSVNGFLRGGFTGAVAGRTTGGATDRDATFDCGNYPSNCTTLSCGGSPCCPACENENGIIKAPSCYFAANLPCATGSGFEYGLTMGEWAAYRSGAASTCQDATAASVCAAMPGCDWSGGACQQAYCSSETRSVDCDGRAHCKRVGVLGRNACNADSECSWSNGECALNACADISSVYSCRNDARCVWDGGCVEHVGWACAPLDEVTCGATSDCTWQDAIGECATNYCASISSEGLCESRNKCGVSYSGSVWQCRDEFSTSMPGNCEWDAFTKLCLPATGTPCGNATSWGACEDLRSHCSWDANDELCRPRSRDNSTLCGGITSASCQNLGGTFEGQPFCQWDGSSCAPISRYGFRKNAARVAVMLSDEEACSLRDGGVGGYLGDFGNNGYCEWFGDYGKGLTSYSSSIRSARTRSFTDFYRARGFTVFAITGDKPFSDQSPRSGNGGCNANGNRAEAGQGYIAVAEGTGGGWGSICAADLYPSIESIVISAIGKGSVYKLESAINGRAVQPIASTIQVTVEVCDNVAEYPKCSSGRHMQVVPRSRDNGYDYDGLNNTLILYGDARAARKGDITVSYRYWVDYSQPSAGNAACPCPGTSSPSCSCPGGLACGDDGSGGVSTCEPLAENACGQTPGCTWNTVEGCLVNGLCEPDPTCGGGCAIGERCDPQSGLCVCDQSCGNACGAGERCDFDGDSPTCGACICDRECGGGCPAGQRCDDTLTSGTCGQCACDLSCGGACTGNLVCNTDVSSPSCGFCEPPQCGSCPPGNRCDPATGLCVCDQECGGGCPGGQRCDADLASGSCGQCLCDPTCGGSCPFGTLCMSDATSASCGRCLIDPTCGGPCSEGEQCNPVTGLCEPVCPECGTGQICDPVSAQCVCDSTCGGACPEGAFCDGEASSETCGTCVCDTTCGGGGCPAGQLCDDGASCAGLNTEGACQAAASCVVDSDANACFSPSCGKCMVDSTCGGACAAGTVCNPLSGLCTADPDCGGCPPNFQCDVLRGQCEPIGG